jgi:CelD/BcsL family acetyltransferase involved in cellulose biosynthesis
VLSRRDHQEAYLAQEITTTTALEELAPEWTELWRADPRATPFQSPAWLIPWWKHIGEGSLLTLALRRASGELAAIVPWYVRSNDSGEREVLLLGAGTTDYLEGVFSPAEPLCAAAAAFGYLERRRELWDVVDLQQLRAGSPLLWAQVAASWDDRSADGEACPTLRLPDAAEGLAGVVPARMLQNLHYYRRRAERVGALRFECATPETLQSLFDAHVQLHRARWSKRAEPGVLDRESVQAAHRASLPQLFALGVLRLYALRLDGRIIATLQGFIDPPTAQERRFYYYLGGFDPELERLSPGTLLIGHAVQRAIEERCTIFDFLRGEEAYKYLWGAHDSATRRRRLERRTRTDAGRERAPASAEVPDAAAPNTHVPSHGSRACRDRSP